MHCHFVIIVITYICHFVIILINLFLIYFIHFLILKIYKNEKHELRHTICLLGSENKNKIKKITTKKNECHDTSKI